MKDVQVIEITTPRLVKQFIRFPELLYKEYPLWVPPLQMEIKEKLDHKKNPFFEYGKVKLFGVLNQHNHFIARGAAILNPRHNAMHRDRTGFFGLFESRDDPDAAQGLMQAIKDCLKQWNCDTVMGPVNFTTNDESGFLIQGFDSPPAFMTNYCPPYYQTLMKECGFEKAMDLYCYDWSFDHTYPEIVTRIVNRLEKNSPIRIRSIVRKELKNELKRIQEIYNTSFSDVWGFVPITDKETGEMGKAFTLFADDDLIVFAEIDKKTIGFCLILPDVNEIIKKIKGRLFPFGFIYLLLKRKKIRNSRTMVICVHPDYRFSGAVILMIDRLHKRGKAKGYKKCELTVVIESNKRIRDVLTKLQFKVNKTYRVYQSIIMDEGKKIK
ncbi:MAG: hypothetical protein JXJ04_03905 [Spirochaetales bacterium]|nr:hypothetical protein [Spirochaetales bacterium]